MGGAQTTHIANGYLDDIKARVTVDKELSECAIQESRRKGNASWIGGKLTVGLHLVA